MGTETTAADFERRVDECLRRIHRKLDAEDPDAVEASLGDGVLTIEFPGGSKFLVSRQSAARQIWVAAGARAWHYRLDPAGGGWIDDKDGHDLYKRLSEAVSEKLGRTIEL